MGRIFIEQTKIYILDPVGGRMLELLCIRSPTGSELACQRNSIII